MTVTITITITNDNDNDKDNNTDNLNDNDNNNNIRQKGIFPSLGTAKNKGTLHNSISYRYTMLHV